MNIETVFKFGHFFFVFDCTCVGFDEFATVCSICAEISSIIHFDCDAGVGYALPISLPPAINLPLPSTIQPPSLELKPLPKHLKCAYLDDGQKLLVMISNSLSLEHEDKLLLYPYFPIYISLYIVLPMEVWEFNVNILRLSFILSPMGVRSKRLWLKLAKINTKRCVKDKVKTNL